MLSLKEAKQITGHKSGLGKPGKMPGYSTSIPARHCKVGQELAKIKGSVCAVCYAHNRGNYTFPDVKKGLQARFDALQAPRWNEAMARLISHYVDEADPFFRIHDSGDLQSKRHLMAWVAVARMVPWVKFWLPTKETRLFKAVRVMLGASWPANLVVRMSAPMIGQSPPRSMAGYLTSTVAAGHGFECEAYKRSNKCGPCRACWNPAVQNIDYHKQ